MSDLDALEGMDTDWADEVVVVEPDEKEQKPEEAKEKDPEVEVEQEEPVAAKAPSLGNSQKYEPRIQADLGADGGLGKGYYESGQDKANDAAINQELNEDLLDLGEVRRIAANGPRSIGERAQLRMAQRAGKI